MLRWLYISRGEIRLDEADTLHAPGHGAVPLAAVVWPLVPAVPVGVCPAAAWASPNTRTAEHAIRLKFMSLETATSP